MVTDAPAYAAIDLGASSGRVMTGRLAGGRLTLDEVHRFHNRPVRLPDGLRWNLLHLFTEALDGLRGAGPLRGVGVDSWGVDYALLDGRDRVLGLPFHYRDERTEGMDARAFARVPAAELYATTGIQTMPINTVFQLLADQAHPPAAALAHAVMDELGFGADRKSVAIWRYRLHAGSVGELMRSVDGVFADRFRAMEGFEAWHVFDCGGDEIVWISFVRDHAVAEESDERAFRFVCEELRDFRLERRAALRGELMVSRARTELLEPAHA